MLTMPSTQIPFEWLPTLNPGEWIGWLDIWIDRYPQDYSVYSNGRHHPGCHVYWVEDGKRLAPDVYINYYTQRLYPPTGAKPVGIYSDSPNHAHLRGEAFIATIQNSPSLDAIAARIEPMIIALGAKIDALE